MKKLHKHVLFSFFGPLALTFFIVIFLLLMQFLWKYVDDLVGKGLDIYVLSELMFYASASFVPMALPLAILIASLMTFGNMGENYELTAIKSAGISLTRIMSPLIIFLSFIALLAFFYSNNTLPYFNLKMRSLIYDIQQQRPEIQIKEGAFYNGIENYSIKIGRRDQKSNLLHDIIIYDHSAGMGNISVTIADSGYIKITADKQTLMVILFNGESYNEITNDTYNSKSKNNPLRRDKFSKQVINIELTGFDLERTNEELFKGSYQMMNISQLKKMIDSMRLNIEVDRVDLKNNLNSLSYTLKTNVGIEKDSIKKDSLNLLKQKLNFTTLYNSLSSTEKLSAINIGISSAQNAKSMLSSEISIRKSKIKRMMKHEIELHRKFTLSVACIVFFLIGAPLGAIIRKGGLGMPLVISVFFFVLYYVITLMGEKFVRETILTPFEGVWISTFILLPLGAFLTYKATSDAALMNIESYMQAINKVVNLRFIFLRKKQKT